MIVRRGSDVRAFVTDRCKRLVDREPELFSRIVQRETEGGVCEQLESDSGVIVRELGEGDDTIDVLASDATVDRYGDVIEPLGWDLANYLLNPVHLVDHNYRVEAIAGRTLAAETSDDGLVLRVQIGSDDIPAAKLIRALLRLRMIRATSVGFIPTAWERIFDDEGEPTGGFRFTAQELLENSFVAVPANPNALIQDAIVPPVDDALQLSEIGDAIRAAAITSSLHRLGRS